MPILINLTLDQLRAIRRAAQRLAELDYAQYAHWCDVAADVDAEISRRIHGIT